MRDAAAHYHCVRKASTIWAKKMLALHSAIIVTTNSNMKTVLDQPVDVKQRELKFSLFREYFVAAETVSFSANLDLSAVSEASVTAATHRFCLEMVRKNRGMRPGYAPLLRSLGPDRCNEHRVVLNALRPDDVGRHFRASHQA